MYFCMIYFIGDVEREKWKSEAFPFPSREANNGLIPVIITKKTPGFFFFADDSESPRASSSLGGNKIN